MVAYSFGKAFIHPGDEIIISEMEHHSNIVPWQLMCEDRKASLKVMGMRESSTTTWSSQSSFPLVKGSPATGSGLQSIEQVRDGPGAAAVGQLHKCVAYDVQWAAVLQAQRE